jgi:hypothetical protein
LSKMVEKGADHLMKSLDDLIAEDKGKKGFGG